MKALRVLHKPYILGQEGAVAEVEGCIQEGSGTRRPRGKKYALSAVAAAATDNAE